MTAVKALNVALVQSLEIKPHVSAANAFLLSSLLHVLPIVMMEPHQAAAVDTQCL
jgi:hypothetical protein